MTTYRVKICCCNCYAEREYDIERGVPHGEAELICPNCGCFATTLAYTVIALEKKTGTYILKKNPETDSGGN